MKNMLLTSTALGAAIAGLILIFRKTRKNNLTSREIKGSLAAGQEVRNPLFSMG